MSHRSWQQAVGGALVGVLMLITSLANAQGAGPGANRLEREPVPELSIRPAQPAQRLQLPPGQVIDASRLNNAQFRSLPDSAVIQFKDRQLTAGEIRASFQQHREAARADLKRRMLEANNDFGRRRQEFFARRKADLDAKNQKLRVEFSRRITPPQPNPAPLEKPPGQ